MVLKMDKYRAKRRKNLLLRYRAVLEEFNRHDSYLMPIAVIHRQFIYPKFHISRNTLYRILSMDVEAELAQL